MGNDRPITIGLNLRFLGLVTSVCSDFCSFTVIFRHEFSAIRKNYKFLEFSSEVAFFEVMFHCVLCRILIKFHPFVLLVFFFFCFFLFGNMFHLK